MQPFPSLTVEGSTVVAIIFRNLKPVFYYFSIFFSNQRTVSVALRVGSLEIMPRQEVLRLNGWTYVFVRLTEVFVHLMTDPED